MRLRFWPRARKAPETISQPRPRPAKNEAGWETSFGEFRRLLGELHWRAVVAPLLKDWYGCDVVGAKGSPQLVSASGAPMSLRDVHDRIQADPDRRYDFYQRKMSCFHWDDFAERFYAASPAGQAPGRGGTR